MHDKNASIFSQKKDGKLKSFNLFFPIMLKISKASAGSGKTYQLAQEYITLLLGYYDSETNTHRLYINHPLAHDTHKRILAITFTIKATEEMKKRIVKQLHILSTGAESDYLKDLMSLYNATENDVRRGAKRALRDLLSKFSFFNVSTIDSFFQTILRSMAFELDQSGDFAVEINDDTVLGIALQDLIGSLRSGFHIPDDERKLRYKLEKYLIGNIDGKSDWNLLPRSNSRKNWNHSSLSDIIKYINSENFKLKIADINNYFSQPGKLDKFRNDVLKQMEATLAHILSVAKSLPDALAESGIYESQISYKNQQPFRVVYTAMGITSVHEAELKLDNLAPNDTFIKKYENPDLLFKKDANITGCKPILSLLSQYLEFFHKYAFLKIATENLDALSLIYDVYMQMEKYREDNDTVLLSQTTELLSKIVTTDDTPFIFERMGIAPKHFLIDEFQDTSKMQWQILAPMLRNNLGNGHSSLIIGDVKQSIYRFRNADPSLLHSGINSSFANFIPPTYNSGNIELSTNYRSRENIVKFNNTFFTLLAHELAADKNAPLLLSSYENVVQHVCKKKKDTGGHITIDFFNSQDSDSSPQSDDDILIDIQLDKALEYAVGALHRGYKPSQIAFLARTGADNEDTVKYIIRHLDLLTEANDGTPVTVVSDESLLLCNSPIVNSIISMLEFISGEASIGNDFDMQNRNLYLPLIAQFFHKKLAESHGDASLALQQAMEISIPDLRLTLKKSLNPNNSSLYTVIEQIIDSFDEDSRNDETAYLLAFQDIVLDYANNNTPSVPAFLKWWKNNCNKLSITTPPNDNAINVMTIHKSKGLEFEILIIPRCDWTMLSVNDLIWFDTKTIEHRFNSDSTPPVIPLLSAGKLHGIGRSNLIQNTELRPIFQCEIEQALADGLNLTYVAFTRAKSELHIISSGNQNDTIGKHLETILKLDNSLYERCIYNRYPDIDTASHFLYLNNSFAWGAPTTPPEKEDTNDNENVEQLVFASYDVASNTVEPNYSAEIIPPGIRGEGIRMHKIMEGILTPEDVELSVRCCASKGFIQDSIEEIKHFTKIFSDYISQQEPASWFSNDIKVYRERWMAYNGKQYRADRIVIRPDNSVVVIDFKFGEDAEHIY